MPIWEVLLNKNIVEINTSKGVYTHQLAVIENTPQKLNEKKKIKTCPILKYSIVIKVETISLTV